MTTTAVIADGWMGLSLHKHGGTDEHVQWMMRWDETSVLPWLAATSVFFFFVVYVGGCLLVLRLFPPQTRACTTVA